jgi:hypothetical protein
VAVGHAYDWWKKCKCWEEWKSTVQALLDISNPLDWTHVVMKTKLNKDKLLLPEKQKGKVRT